MSKLSFYVSSIAFVSALMIGGPVHAAIQGFVGPWAPTVANGFENATQNNGTFTTGVNPAGNTLTSDIANAGDLGHASFFLGGFKFGSEHLPVRACSS